MKESLGLNKKRNIRSENLGQDFLCRLHQALGPSRLLRLEAVHIHRQFGSALNFRQVKKFPALQLRAVRKIGVFREGVVLPAAGGINRRAAPNAGGPIKVEKCSPARAAAMLNYEMPIEQNRLHARQKGIVAVQIRPPRLHHPDLAFARGIKKIRDRASKKISLWDKIRVENCHELALRRLQPILQRRSEEHTSELQ